MRLSGLHGRRVAMRERRSLEGRGPKPATPSRPRNDDRHRSLPHPDRPGWLLAQMMDCHTDHFPGWPARSAQSQPKPAPSRLDQSCRTRPRARTGPAVLGQRLAFHQPRYTAAGEATTWSRSSRRAAHGRTARSRALAPSRAIATATAVKPATRQPRDRQQIAFYNQRRLDDESRPGLAAVA